MTKRFTGDVPIYADGTLRSGDIDALKRFDPELPFVLGTQSIRRRLEAAGLVERTKPDGLVEWRITEAGHEVIRKFGNT